MFLAVLQRVRTCLQFGRQFSVIEKLYVAVQIRLYIFHCSIFSPQMQGFSCIWVIFLSKAKKSSSQELSYGIESFKPPASKKQMIFGVRLDAALARHFVFPMGHIHSRPRRNHGVLFCVNKL